MKRLSLPGVNYIPYFPLCRELGADVVDGMVRGRLLELRWSRTVNEEVTTAEGVDVEDDIGPKLIPTTPILSYAMRVVLDEWDSSAS